MPFKKAEDENPKLHNIQKQKGQENKEKNMPMGRPTILNISSPEPQLLSINDPHIWRLNDEGAPLT